MNTHYCRRSPIGLGTLLLIALEISVLAFSAPVSSNPASRFSEKINQVTPRRLLDQTRPGDHVDLEDFRLKGEASPLNLELERFEVFAPDGRVIVNNGRTVRELVPPSGAHFRGRVQGMTDSLAVINIDRHGKTTGLVDVSGRVWSLENPQGDLDAKLSLDIRELALEPDATLREPFSCGLNDLPGIAGTPTPAPIAAQQTIQPLAAALPAGQFYQAKVAIETDYQLYQKFNNLSAVNTYIENLFAYVSSIYEKENQTQLLLGNVYLYSSANASPWSSATWRFSNTTTGLTKFSNYWKQYRANIPRTTAHFLSGQPLGGGIAYISALCNNNYAYGLSASLSGKVSTSQTIWDTMVVAHEIGHNFGSPHTHDYQNIGGEAKPVDACYLGGPNGPYTPGYLPGLNSLSGGAPGSGAGTIMSYCHNLNGGYGNTTMTFGKNHTYGIKAYRVTDKIGNYVATTASTYPSCLPTVSSSNPLLSVTKAGSGAGTVSSNPTGIDCGNTCSSSFTKGTNVVLTPSPASGSVFAGWTGACSGTGSCSIAMNANQSVTATFNLQNASAFSLTVTKSGNGTVTSTPAGINCGNACASTFATNTTVTLTAKPATGYRFSGWSNGCSGTATSCQVKMSSNKTVKATFVLGRTR